VRVDGHVISQRFALITEKIYDKCWASDSVLRVVYDDGLGWKLTTMEIVSSNLNLSPLLLTP
jgi:hypothetical protein